jgi:hypothetical protein
VVPASPSPIPGTSGYEDNNPRCPHVTGQAPFAENDDVVQVLAADCADDAFDISLLLGRTGCRQQLVDPHGFQLIHEIFPEDPVAITE